MLFHQPGLRSIWEKYYEEAHAVVYVIDASCPSRFEDSKSALGNVYSERIFKTALRCSLHFLVFLRCILKSF